MCDDVARAKCTGDSEFAVEERLVRSSRTPGRMPDLGKICSCRTACFARNSGMEMGSWAQVWKILLA